MTENQITLWTIQTLDKWEEFKRRKILVADGRRVFQEYRPAYRWMMQQMRLRLPKYSGRYPIWAWYQPKPDLHQEALLPRGTPGVRIEFTAPHAQVLLSCFGPWHCVLGDWYLPATEQEGDEFRRLWRSAQSRRSTQNAYEREALQERKQLTWERIFDLDGDAIWEEPDHKHIQAVVETVRLDQVVRVHHFVAR